MYRRILVAVAPDHPETIDEMLQVARGLAEPGATIEALSVVSAIPTYIEVHIPKSIYQASAEEVRQKLEQGLAGQEGVERAVEVGKPSEEILAYQQRGGHDLIVLRSHNPTIGDMVLGSTAARIVRNARCSVHVIR